MFGMSFDSRAEAEKFWPKNTVSRLMYRGKTVGWNLDCVPTWALLEELKRRKGVTYAAKATGDLVGCIETAPAVALTVKLPLED